MMKIIDFDEELYKTADNIEIHRYQKPTDKSVTLTTITAAGQTSEKGFTWHTIRQAQEISEDEALKIANDYAEKSGIGLILKKYD